VKDRFGAPTEGGWADCLVNFSFVQEADGATAVTSGHVCELQLMHEGMLFVRKAMGAHDSYNAYRGAVELLEATGSELPPPLDDDEDAQPGELGFLEEGGGGALTQLIEKMEKLDARQDRIESKLDRILTLLEGKQ
jgi:hypothetical protein